MTQEMIWTLVLTLAAVGVAWLGYVAAVSGGDFGKYFEARGVARRYRNDADFAQNVRALNQPPPKRPITPGC